MMFRKESENRKDCWVSTGEDMLSLQLSPGALLGHTQLRAPLSSLDILEQTAAVPQWRVKTSKPVLSPMFFNEVVSLGLNSFSEVKAQKGEV